MLSIGKSGFRFRNPDFRFAIKHMKSNNRFQREISVLEFPFLPSFLSLSFFFFFLFFLGGGGGAREGEAAGDVGEGEIRVLL